MGPANGGPKRVGGVVGFRDEREAENEPNQLLDLGLIRGSASYHCLFDGHRRVLAHRETPFSQGKTKHASGLGHWHGARDVFCEVKGLNCRLGGTVFIEDRSEDGVNRKEAIGAGKPSLGHDAAVGYIDQPRAGDIHDAPASRRKPRVNAYDAANRLTALAVR